jgi:protein phosphatase 2C
LIKLDLSHNQISGALVGDRFPEDSSIFPVIEEIYLNHNSITELPTMFWRQITNASVIDLRNNRLTSLSEEIEGFFSLSSLEVGGNLLGSLPSQLGQLGSLQVLSFYNNLITELPDLSSLEYLQYLNAGHNQLSEISLEGLSSLEEVFLSGNPIKQLPDNISETCPNLKLLFAADMALKKVPTGLNGLSLLEQIDFSHNRITEIPPALGDLESLRSMSFAHNKLETSKEREVLKTPGKGPWDCIEFWQGFIQILEIDLSHNKLKYVPKGLETKFGTECEVVLIGNPLAETTESKSIFLTPQLGKRYQVGWSEMLGRRPTMEDHFLWQGALDGHNHVDLFAVFDGHAARDAAKFCSEHLPELVKQQLSSEHIKGGNGAKLTKSDKFFHTIFANLNAALEKHLSTVRDSSVKHCGTTAVVVLIVGDTMQIANVGDSRAVLNNGERCTVDHKPRAEVDRIRSHTGGFVTGDGSGRINEVLAVSRSLGDFYMHPWVISEPHIYSRTLLKEDKFIILACDGIWDEVEDQDAVAIVEPLVQEGELFKAASKLRDIAYCAGSDDNISVMIIKLNK